MLYAIDDQEHPIDYMPHAAEFAACRERLSDIEYAAIVEELNRRINGSEIQTSSWIPGSDWTGTVFEPIYVDACRRDVERAGLFFGQIVWQVFMDRDEAWSFGRYEKNGIPIRGLMYFRIDR